MKYYKYNHIIVMSGFILCPECKDLLGRYSSFIEGYILTSKMLNKDICNIDPTKLDLTPNLIPDMKELLDTLGIKKECSRMHILTNADFYKFIINRTEV